jgi:secreted Zn-dependent insulinase-like peptidase
VAALGERGRVPVLLRESPAMRVLYKHDHVFRQPKASVHVLLVTKVRARHHHHHHHHRRLIITLIIRCGGQVISESPESVILTDMLANLVTEKLAEYSYYASIAGPYSQWVFGYLVPREYTI